VAAAWLEEGVVRVLDLATGAVREFQGTARFTQATAFSPDGRNLVIGPVYYETDEFPDGATGLTVLDAASLAQVRTLIADNVGVSLFGFEIAYSPDGRLIACGSADATAKVWDSGSGRLLYSIEGHAAEVLSVDWSDLHDDESNYLFTGSRDGTTLVWKVGDHGYVQVGSFASQDLQGGIAGVALEPGGSRVVVGGNVVQAVKIWDAGIQGDEEQVNMPGDPAGFNPLAFIEDSVLAFSTGDGGVDVWDVSTGATRVGHLPPDDSGNPVTTLEQSPDLRTMAILHFGVGSLVDSQTGDTIHRFEDPLFRVGWSNDGKQLAAVSEGTATVQVFDAAGNLLRTSDGTPGFVGMDVDVRNDGLVAVAELPLGRPDLAANQVVLHDPTNPDQMRVLPADGASGPLAFDPAGERFALAFFDGHLEIWTVDDGSKVVLAGHIGEIKDLAFNADGSTLATAGDDGTVRLWDTATGAPKLVLRGHEARVDSVAFSPDGAFLASAGGDGITRVWALHLDALIDIAQRNVTRQFTDQECRQYLHVESCPPPG
jgi:WD40 repeat protein